MGTVNTLSVPIQYTFYPPLSGPLPFSSPPPSPPSSPPHSYKVKIYRNLKGTKYSSQVHKNNLKCAEQLLLSAAGCHTRPGRSNLKKNHAPNLHFYLHGGVTPNSKGSIALWEHITAFFSRAEKPSEDLNGLLLFINKKGLNKLKKVISSLDIYRKVFCFFLLLHGTPPLKQRQNVYLPFFALSFSVLYVAI